MVRGHCDGAHWHFRTQSSKIGCEVNVTIDRLLDVYALIERLGRDDTKVSKLCSVAQEFMAVDGAAIAILSDDESLVSLCASNEMANDLMNLELTIGEGPAFSASRGGANAAVNLLMSSAPHWEAYGPEAVALGARAAFGFPIRLGAIRFGALSLYRAAPGPLTPMQDADGYLLASVIGRVIVASQAGGAQEDLAGELNGASMLDFRVHQAAGMLAVQGSLSVKDALVLLRAHAFGAGYSLSNLADLIVSKSTYLDAESHAWIDDAVGASDEK